MTRHINKLGGRDPPPWNVGACMGVCVVIEDMYEDFILQLCSYVAVG